MIVTIVLMTRHYGCLGDDLIDLEMADDVRVAIADNEGRVDVRVGVLEEDRLGKMYIAEPLVIDDVAVIVLDDEPELVARRVFVVDLEDDCVLLHTLEGNGDLGVVKRGGLFCAAFVCHRGKWGGKEEKGCGEGNCDYFYCVVFRVGVHNILNFCFAFKNDQGWQRCCGEAILRQANLMAERPWQDDATKI